MQQKRCSICEAIHLGDDYICRTCRTKNPGWKPDSKQLQDSTETILPEYKSTPSMITVDDVASPIGKIHIPKVADRDYRATIIITTPDISGENFRFCKHRLDKNTPGEHRIVVIETHYNEKPYNYARDINIGLRGVQDSDYLVMLNDDVFVESGWLDTLVECARQDNKIGIVGALLYYPGKKIIQHAGGGYDVDVESWAMYGQMPVSHNYGGTPVRKLAPVTYPPTTNYDKDDIHSQKDVPWNTGALLLVTKECVDKAGLMDEELVAHCDDVEYNFRAWLSGFRVVYCPDVQAVHRENVTRKIGTKEVPDYIYNATKRLLRVLPKKKADKVQDMVDNSNKRHYRPKS